MIHEFKTVYTTFTQNYLYTNNFGIEMLNERQEIVNGSSDTSILNK
jgi:hypothetical protein